MEKIKFGTDGWRGVIARDFTQANVAKVAYAIARWLTGKFQKPSAVIGYDSRFGGEMFMEAIAKILASKNIRVFISESFVSSPMVSLGVQKLGANCGIMVTASHRPAEYNGIKLKGSHGGPMLDNDLKDIENLISSDYEFDLEMLNWNYLLEQGLIQYINLESIYQKNIQEHFDIDKLKSAGLRVGFDAMFGSTQNVFRKILSDVTTFRCEPNPSFMGIPPEPVSKNLHVLEEYICKEENIDFAFAVDGDGDRVAMFDEKGNYLDSHHVLLLAIYCLAGYYKLGGKVLASTTITGKVESLCSHFGLEVERTTVGFKDISRKMVDEEILIAGEESGGIALGSYLPERDGVWIGLTIWEWLSASGKKLSEMVDEVHTITGSFAFERLDLALNKNIRNKVIENCANNAFTEFGEFYVTSVTITDGYKYALGDNQWVMIRASGTDPVLRIYAEAETRQQVLSIINSVVKTIQSN